MSKCVLAVRFGKIAAGFVGAMNAAANILLSGATP